VSYQGFLTAVPGIPGSIEAVPPPDLLAYYAPFHTTPACWERNAESLAGYGTLPQGYAYYAQGTVQGYLIHRDNTILDLAFAPQADAEQVSAALLGRMCAAGWTHATLAKVPEDEPSGRVLARLGFTPTADYLLMGQDLQ
jgi:hypothetical protein